MSLRIKLCLRSGLLALRRTANLVSVLCSAERFLLLMEIFLNPLTSHVTSLWHAWPLFAAEQVATSCNSCKSISFISRPERSAWIPVHWGEAGEEPSIFYHFLFRSMTRTHIPFVSWSLALRVPASSFLSPVSRRQLWLFCCLLVGAVQPDFQHAHCRLAATHLLLYHKFSKAAFSKTGREEERS